MKKHTPPIWCYIRRALVGFSPSAMAWRCTLGLRRGCSKCDGCTENITNRIHEGFMAGLREGSTMPYFRVCPYCGAYLDPDEICDCKYDPGTTNTEEDGQ